MGVESRRVVGAVGRLFSRLIAVAAACVFSCAMLAGCGSTARDVDGVSTGVIDAAAEADAISSAPDSPLREGKDQINVLVLNGCGIEGAAEEAADAIRALGFQRVETDNATYFNRVFTRVSYRHEEHRPEVDEIAEALDVPDVGGVYNYGDAKDWGEEYDILVMVGSPDAF
ncbi:RARB Retinoic acid receptor beta [Rubneribacter badeniensis]|jgi:hypothetical protein|uniref:LytR C-terminal domain-containing protein n=1 Tax=Rubneribacter badeniensis TaxID=2070688 RepID=A0A2K2U7G5_9ACTN|nr:LytR C-terminal domain-containing protein [Rubneribacter badeniensis]OUO86637.1 hypothetical protein B5F41_13750 [Gordonibacter sp. An232A]PNV66120.1 RARB Retinoic acid receptor beta [Rubneribacter badeniensis]CVH75568.1 hypothetical protein BN3658_00365 [Coriobacteriaceae bacterium CHKCI002]HJH42469.1 LytR C-terminal domain-containing protein [Rubneribacter badeniensis]